MPLWGKASKVLSTQSDRQMKAPPRMYRQRNSIDDQPEPVKKNPVKSDESSLSAASKKRYSKKAIGRGN